LQITRFMTTSKWWSTLVLRTQKSSVVYFQFYSDIKNHLVEQIIQSHCGDLQAPGVMLICLVYHERVSIDEAVE